MSFTGFPIICFDNLFTRSGVSVTDPGAASGFPASRLRDTKDWAAWKTDGAGTKEYKVDLGVGVTELGRMCFALLGHNLGTDGIGSGWSVDYSTVSITGPWTNAFTAWSIDDDREVISAWNQSTAARYWRVNLTGLTVDAQVSEIVIGRTVSIPDDLVWRGQDFARVDRQEHLSRAEGSGEMVRSWITDFEKRQMATIQWVERAAFFLDDDRIGLRYWYENIAGAGEPFVWHWNASTDPEYRYDGFYAQLDGDLGGDLMGMRSKGPRQIQFTVRGAYV